MPKRRDITKERLEKAASAAVQTALNHILRQTGARCSAELRCSCRGPQDGTAEISGRTLLAFSWEASWEGATINAEVTQRADKVLYAGALAPPRAWTYKLMALSIPRAINEVGGLSWMREGGAGEVLCTGLAMAKLMQEPPESCVLFRGGSRIQHLVLARLTDNKWLCHDGGSLASRRQIFHPDGVVKAGRERIWSAGAHPCKRLRGRIQWRCLEELAAVWPQAYATAVVSAHLAVAAERGKAEVDMALLEKNPLHFDIKPDMGLLVLWRVRAPGAATWQSRMRVLSLGAILRELRES